MTKKIVLLLATVLALSSVCSCLRLSRQAVPQHADDAPAPAAAPVDAAAAAPAEGPSDADKKEYIFLIILELLKLTQDCWNSCKGTVLFRKEF